MALSRDTENKLFITGYTAKGIVYSLIGIFAIAGVVSGAGGQSSGGPKSVIRWIGTNPFGQVLLFLIGIGLLAYCSWRWYTAVQDKKNEGQDKEGVVKRIGYAVSGTAYGVLSAYAFKLAFGSGGGGGGTSKQDIIARMLSESWGPIAVGIIAAIMAGVAFYQLYRALQDKHMEGIEGQQLSHDQRETFEKTGEVGLTARFVVYGIISYFLFRAALMDDPSQFRGIGGSLDYIENQSYGAAMLIAVGLGLLAYGLFMFVRARYERV